MGKAKHPHDSKRPESAAVIEALREGDVEALRLALSPRQRRFAEEYTIDFNGSAACVRAGYAVPYADRQAHLLLKHKGVAFLIDDLLRSKEAKIVSVNPDYVLKHVTDIIGKENAKDGDKLRALELLARHLGMLTDKTEITGKDGGDIAIRQKTEEDANDFMNFMKQLKDRAQPKKDVTLV